MKFNLVNTPTMKGEPRLRENRYKLLNDVSMEQLIETWTNFGSDALLTSMTPEQVMQEFRSGNEDVIKALNGISLNELLKMDGIKNAEEGATWTVIDLLAEAITEKRRMIEKEGPYYNAVPFNNYKDQNIDEEVLKLDPEIYEIRVLTEGQAAQAIIVSEKETGNVYCKKGFNHGKAYSMDTTIPGLIVQIAIKKLLAQIKRKS